jgi:DNA-binding HxlR family transcriptional regulator
VLLLATRERPGKLCEALARLDAALFDPDFDPDDGAWEDGWDGEDEWAALEDDRPLPPAPEEHLRAEPALPRAARELHYVGRVLTSWLEEAPAGPLRVREEEGMLAIGALAAGWSSTVVHALSGAALTLEELEAATGAVNREELEARLRALEDNALIELLEGPAGEVRFAATPWLRRGIAPLAAAARFERRLGHPAAAPPDLLDVGAAFLLALPPLELPAEIDGVCRLGVWMPGGQRVPGHRNRMAGATARVEGGRVVSVDLKLDPSPGSWAVGTPIGWLDTLVDPGAERIDFGGDPRLAEALVEGLRELLFGDVSGGEDAPEE